MRINVYTEEMLGNTSLNPPVCELIWADYISSRTGKPMRNWGVRIFVKSHPDLHYIPGRDDDRSAVTFWCGDSQKKCFEFLDGIRSMAKHSTHEDINDPNNKNG